MDSSTDVANGGLPAPETRSMRTRDGTRLDADVYRPPGEGPWPVLLLRQAYGRKVASTLCYAHPSWYAKQGYMVVVQDVRGRGTSEGSFEPLEHEAFDGADAVAWAATLDGADGAVGMYGFSYQGVNQLLAACEPGPHLKALAPAMIGWNIHDDWAYENGAFNLSANLGWAVQLAAENARLGGDLDAFFELHALARRLPFDSPNPARPPFMDRFREWSHYHRWLDEPREADYWRELSPSAHAETLRARALPMLFIGGWFDTHLPGTLAAFDAMAGAAPARLEVGPWTHFPWDRRVGGLDFGAEAIGAIDHLQIRWFDRWLKGVQNGVEFEPAIGLFDMGARRWRRFAAWPRTTRTLFLSSDGRGAVDGAAGRLVPGEDALSSVDTLVHDPWRPAPSVGGAFGSPPGPVDRAAVDARADVLTFTTAPLEAPLAIAGQVDAEILVRADAPHFDLCCTLSRVTAGGQPFQVAEGYWSGTAPEPNRSVRVPLRATCVTLMEGERLRLSIAAASFPARPVNPGTGERPQDQTIDKARIITLGVITGPGASRLHLCIPPDEEPPP
jgi:putative CocE/NonD family hydrolase